jgi:hypothetical protein
VKRAPRALVLILIFAAALFVRLWLSAGHATLTNDERDYDSLAWTLASTGAYAEGGVPTAYRSIGYPAFVAGIYSVSGRTPRAVQAVQAFLDLATAGLLFVLLARRSRRAALLAAAIWAAYPAAILFSGALLSETLFAFLLVLFALLLDRAPPRPAAHVVPGLILGALALVKPEVLVFAALLVPLLLLRGLRLAEAAALLGGAALLVAPWVIRNEVVFGKPLFTTNDGANLLIGNNPEATGAYGPASVPARVREARGELAANQESRHAALAFIASRPGRFLALAPVKAAHVLSSDAELAVGRFGAPSTASYRQRYRSLPVAVHLAVSLPYFALVLAGLLGLVARSGGTERIVFAALAVSILLVHVVTFGGSRFHFPWMPFFALSAAGLADGGRARATPRAPAIAAALLVALAFVSVWVAEALALAR